jgi:rRNA processing protein Gar1
VPQIPYFNAPIYLENKTQIGKVEEILGSVNNVVRAMCSASAKHAGRLSGFDG